jgi:branched-subunit amino acid transport protein
MSIGLIAAIALLTYGSRAIALVLMPDPPARIQAVLDRIPAPLFAALAATSLIADGAFVEVSTLTAALFALAASPTRSLLWVLIAGVAGYAVGALIIN